MISTPITPTPHDDAEGLVPKTAGTSLLEPREVFDQQLFEREMVRVHGRSWILLGDTEDLEQPGDYITARIGLQKVIVVVDRDGSRRGFLNSCRHRASSLCDDPAGNTGRFLTCPYHQWSYRLNGELAVVPDQDRMYGRDFDRGDYSLVPIRIEVGWGKLVFGCLSARTPSLRDWVAELGPRYDRMGIESTRRHPRELDQVYTMNWKVFLENANDDYHVRFVHPRPGSQIDPLGTRNFAEGWVCSSYKPYDRDLDPGPDFPHGPSFDGTGFFADFIFPSVNPLVPVPGQLVTVRNEPLTPTSTRLVTRVYTSDGNEAEAEELLDDIDRTNTEDTDMIAVLMDGLRSPFLHVGPAASWERRSAHVMDLVRAETAREVAPGEFTHAWRR